LPLLRLAALFPFPRRFPPSQFPFPSLDAPPDLDPASSRSVRGALRERQPRKRAGRSLPVAGPSRPAPPRRRPPGPSPRDCTH